MTTLARTIADHETFFAGLAQANPHSHVLREFLRVGWDPFISDWYNPALTKDEGAYAGRLSSLLGNAAALAIPLPPPGWTAEAVGSARGAAGSRLLGISRTVAPPIQVSLTTELHGSSLVVKACLDGRCYEGTADLSQIAAELGALGEQYHRDLHVQAGSPLVPVDHPLVGATTEALVGGFIDQHQDTTIGGWWHSLTHGASSVAHGIAGGVQGTLRVLGPEIAVAAGLAATAALGPEAGPIAAKLSSGLVAAASGQGGAKAAGQALVASAEQIAQTNPQMAKAVAVAKRSVAQATAAYHVAQTAQQAASGDPAAAAQVAELVQAASDGDPAAAQVMATAKSAYDQASAMANGDGSAVASSGDPFVEALHPHGNHHHHRNHRHGVTASVSPRVGNMAVTKATIDRQRQEALDAYYAANGTPDTISKVAEYERAYLAALGSPVVASVVGAVSSARDRAMEAARRAQPAAAYVYVETANGSAISPEPSLDVASDRYAALDKNAITYAAIFDPSDPTWPEPISDEVGEVVRAAAPAGMFPRGLARVSGSCRVGAESNATATAINAETDRRFWSMYGLPVGYRIDPHSTAGRGQINEWLNVRYQVANESAAAGDGSVPIAGDPLVGSWPAVALALGLGAVAGRFGGQALAWVREEIAKRSATHKAA